ncbi:MAG: Rieske 2Fe-2S domain-containing protein [Actinobacteria bacterium]|nr:Rieske 2Fe-2S domain-containing protein [Actinomycetota bacterium]
MSDAGYVPPFPKGWYVVAGSDEVPGPELVALGAFGRDLVMGRDAAGEVRVTQDLCPHVGGLFSQGGRITDDCIVCPFHGWKFAADGACIEVPAGDSIPERARVRMWKVRERDGCIEVFHGRRGQVPDPDAEVFDRR